MADKRDAAVDPWRDANRTTCVRGGRINLMGDLSVPFLALVLLPRSSPVSSGHDMASKKSGSKAALGPDASTTWLRKWATRAVIAFVVYVTYSVLDRIKVCAPFR